MNARNSDSLFLPEIEEYLKDAFLELFSKMQTKRNIGDDQITSPSFSSYSVNTNRVLASLDRDLGKIISKISSDTEYFLKRHKSLTKCRKKILTQIKNIAKALPKKVHGRLRR